MQHFFKKENTTTISLHKSKCYQIKKRVTKKRRYIIELFFLLDYLRLKIYHLLF